METGAAPDVVSFACPRCGADVTEAFYGPCGACRDDLALRLSGEAREVTVAAYEPKVNVTPNAVASKE